MISKIYLGTKTYYLFYEIKRTDLDEFEERSMLIDNRDIKDFHLLQNLKNDGLKNNLLYIDKNIINILDKTDPYLMTD